MVFALTGIGLVASFAAHHPFDHLRNYGARHVLGGPVLAPNPRCRRDAFEVATVWLAIVAMLVAAGAATMALVLGGLLVAACVTVTATNLSLPSQTLARLEHRRAPRDPITI